MRLRSCEIRSNATGIALTVTLSRQRAVGDTVLFDAGCVDSRDWLVRRHDGPSPTGFLHAADLQELCQADTPMPPSLELLPFSPAEFEAGSRPDMVAALNAAVAAGSTEFIAFVAHAAAAPASAFQSAVAVLEQAPGAAAVVAVPEPNPPDPGLRLIDEHSPAAAFLISPAWSLRVLFRRDRFNALGGLRPVEFPLWDWLIRAALSSERVRYHEGLFPNSPAMKAELHALTPARPPVRRTWLLEHLHHFEAAGLAVANDETAGTALMAGLYQWCDFLEESHERSQRIEGQGAGLPGDCWHAIMHRREPDYANARYWFRRVGRQAMFSDLQACAAAILQATGAITAEAWRARLSRGGWDPLAFVDLCEACATPGHELETATRRIQRCEMTLLLNATFAIAMRR